MNDDPDLDLKQNLWCFVIYVIIKLLPFTKAALYVTKDDYLLWLFDL